MRLMKFKDEKDSNSSDKILKESGKEKNEAL